MTGIDGSFGGGNGLKKLLLVAVGDELSASGYQPKPAKHGFVRKQEAAVWIYQLVFLENGIGWRIQPSVGIRIERVEEIFHRTSGFEIKYQKDTLTIGGFIGSIRGGTNRDCEFLLNKEEDIPQVADALIRILHDFAVPWFERFSSLPAIDAELNDKPSERTPNRVAPWLRCATGSIVARLVDRPNYDELVAIYVDAMRSSDKGFYLERYQALLDWLAREDVSPRTSG